jgi:hypothetical protein
MIMEVEKTQDETGGSGAVRPAVVTSDADTPVIVGGATIAPMEDADRVLTTWLAVLTDDDPDEGVLTTWLAELTDDDTAAEAKVTLGTALFPVAVLLPVIVLFPVTGLLPLPDTGLLPGKAKSGPVTF